MRSVLDVIWLLVGVVSGLSICVMIASRPYDFTALANLAAFAMLLGSVQAPRNPSRIAV